MLSDTPPPTILALVARPLINDTGQPQARLDIEGEVRRLRERLGEANTLLALAPFSENAEEVFRIALSLYEATRTIQTKPAPSFAKAWKCSRP